MGLIVVLVILAIGLIGIVAIVRNSDHLFNRVSKAGTSPVSDEARQIHFSSLVIDMHSDALMWDRDLLERNSIGHADLPRLVEGGVSLQVFAAGTNFAIGPSMERHSASWPDWMTLHAVAFRWPKRTYGSWLQRALFMADRLHEYVARSDGKIRLIRTVQDLEALQNGKLDGENGIGGLLSIEGAHALEGKLSNLEVLFKAGFRMIGLTHFIDNAFAGSANGMERGGLTELGKELIREMERLGLVPDLAHASPQTIQDVVAFTEKPVLASHTGVRGTCDKDRNLSDDEILAIANSGGVIGIAFGDFLICGDQIEDIVRSVQHVVKLVGDEHVALGSDFDGGIKCPFDATGMPALTQALLDAGLEEESIRKILGGNALRVMEAWLPIKG